MASYYSSMSRLQYFMHQELKPIRWPSKNKSIDVVFQGEETGRVMHNLGIIGKYELNILYTRRKIQQRRNKGQRYYYGLIGKNQCKTKHCTKVFWWVTWYVLLGKIIWRGGVFQQKGFETGEKKKNYDAMSGGVIKPGVWIPGESRIKSMLAVARPDGGSERGGRETEGRRETRGPAARCWERIAICDQPASTGWARVRLHRNDITAMAMIILILWRAYLRRVVDFGDKRRRRRRESCSGCSRVTSDRLLERRRCDRTKDLRCCATVALRSRPGGDRSNGDAHAHEPAAHRRRTKSGWECDDDGQSRCVSLALARRTAPPQTRNRRGGRWRCAAPRSLCAEANPHRAAAASAAAAGSRGPPFPPR